MLDRYIDNSMFVEIMLINESIMTLSSLFDAFAPQRPSSDVVGPFRAGSIVSIMRSGGLLLSKRRDEVNSYHVPPQWHDSKRR